MSAKTKKRKLEHLKVCLKKNVEYGSAWFEHAQFVHNAATQLDLDSIDTRTKVLGKTLKYPLMIAALTGGISEAKQINKGIAKVCEKLGIGFGLGSQRAMIEDAGTMSTFYVRGVAPKTLVLGNIGAANLKEYGRKVDRAARDVGCDGICVHFNATQEAIQPEGDVNFKGSLAAMKKLKTPVVVKESGSSGISREAAKAFKKHGAKMVDVGGLGGTNWAAVEAHRRKKDTPYKSWGIPTAASVMECRGILPIIATGGVRNGLDAAKAVALGADCVGIALPALKWYKKGVLEKELNNFLREFKIAMLLTGSRNIRELKKSDVVITGALKEWCAQRKIR